MTAEIAILNKSAVALAADSAVTYGSKIYNSVNKLFTLSKHEPVGIMIYNNAELMGVPMDVIIKKYREELGPDSFNTISEYGEHFIEYLQTCDVFFDGDVELNSYERIISQHFTDIRNNISDKVSGYLQSKSFDDLTDSEALTIFQDYVNNIHKQWEQAKYRDGFDKDSLEIFLKKFDDLYQRLINDFFPMFSKKKKFSKKLKQICAFIYLKNEFSRYFTGIVISGYGKDDIYPKITSYLVSNSIDRKLKYQENKHKQISNGLNASINPYAQTKIAEMFIKSVHPDYVDAEKGYLAGIKNGINEVLEKKFDDYSNKLPNDNDDLKESLKDLKDEIFDKINKDFVNLNRNMVKYQRDSHINPLLSAVSVLPKDELATLAETLVSLTSFKQKMSMDSETVGGPIDVAVISKGDGFVWIKRKHYFEKELNFGFFQNYFKNRG